MIFFTLLLYIGCAVSYNAGGKLNIFHEWKFLDFLWHSDDQKSWAVNNGDYDVKSCFPFDTDQSPDGRIFVTIVKDAGVPATLTTVSSENGPGGPLLQPYPNWAWNQNNKCKGMIGVYRIAVYMADVEGYGLITWDGKDFRRLESKEFRADPNSEHFTIGNYSFDLADGILGMAITPDEPKFSERLLYFRPLASLYMYNVKLGSLMKKDQSDIRYVQKPNKMRSQSAAQAFSRNGVLFFSSLSDMSLICWNRHKTFNDENTVQFAVDEETLQFPSGVKVVPWGNDDKLLVMTNRYQKAVNNAVNFTDINFRIVGGIVSNLIKGTKCD